MPRRSSSASGLFDGFEQLEGAPDPALWELVRPRLEAHATAAAALGTKAESVPFDVAKLRHRYARDAEVAAPLALDAHRLLAVAAELEAKLRVSSHTTCLPDDVDFEFVNALAPELIRAAL